ncbi:MAG TPA: NPCBM/NEW2 domain-containing protein, partial [Pseudolysinimonas sp.]|nr:NPCBM/NEW2 domain-containing protein [Pseudolysinimonas sp.]
MSSRAPARTLLAIAASAAVLAGSLLASPAASVASTPPPDGESVQLTPELRLDPTGANPCVGASEAAMAAIHCVGRLLDPVPVAVPSDLIPPQVSSDIKPNCTPGVITPASPSTGIAVTVTSGRTSSRTTEENGAKWDTVGASVSVAVESSVIFAKETTTVTASYSHTWVSGWSHSWTEALQSSYSVANPYEEKIPAYHWAVSTFTPSYERIRVLWTWDEPELSAQRPGVRAGAVDTLYFPQASSGKVEGSWKVRMVPMSPAEIDACSTPKGPILPSPVDASFVGPTQGRYLDEMPTMYATGPLTAPVLTSGAGTASSFKPRAALVKSRIPGEPVEYDYLDHSLQLTGDSEVAFWTAGQCTALTARIGYGQNLKIEAPGIARDTLEVWSGRITGGRVEPVKLLRSTLVPLAPAQGIYGADTYQARISADTTSAEVLILKTVRGAGTSDPLSSQDPGVIIGDPHIECAGTGQTVLRSKYVDPITTYDLHLAGTPEQIAANPTEYRAPNLVENGWQCNNQPESLKPLTTVGQSCGGKPLRINGQEYAVGIGAHSGSVDNGAGVHSAAKIRWEHLPPTCTTLSFGVGFDDEVPADWRMNHTITVKSLLYDAPTESTVEPRVIDSIYLNGDGRDGIKQVKLDTVGLGSRMIEIDMDVAYNGNGHVDVVNPLLSCRTQGGTVSSYTPKPAPNGPIEVAMSTMTPTRKTNFWGPVEVDMSNGESAAYDG